MPNALTQHFGLRTAILLVIATMIGTGVFTTTGFLMRDLGSQPAVLMAWLLGGLAAACGSLAYAELVAALPHNGGEYRLLGRIYHPALGFIAGFVSLVVGFAAPIAASAIAFGEYLNMALGSDRLPPVVSGLVLVVGASILHSVRLSAGSRVQDLFTWLKLLLILLFILGGLFAIRPERLAGQDAPPMLEAVLSPAFAVGLIYISYAYTGWNAAAYVAGEVRDPGRRLPIALMLGTLTVTLLYLGLNAVFLGAAPPDELAAANERVGHVAASHIFGESGGRLLSGLIALGLVSTVGALVMTGPRIYEAMGRDYRAMAWLARRVDGGGPSIAIWLQSGLAILMLVTASFETLISYAGFTLSVFAALTVAGVFVLRAREPDLIRPYRTWGHPFTTLGFLALMGWMVLHAIHERPLVVAVGAATVGAGWLAYRLARRSNLT
ncbi:APC family permease [Allochromatium vinosum]|uniref:Amino acid permease-associated region n=1 Tax=Allochromatium vinosum (strain ATCC 17899 / DSM 180 / NBRC 103801 / NCIMB 10441 / D) TaxID=572477 RepID=D3RS78_ALLVD|nr:amino acid permease [Allochromatium vinosum]ADC64015.1 amino acid permease-associated region [Allochromatium vinosum DSM 180]